MTAKELLAALALPLEVVERTTTLPALQHIRIAGGKAMAANGVATIEVNCPLEFSCCVPAKRLADALAAIAMFAGETEVKAKLGSATLELKAGRTRYTMPTLAADDFPVPAWPETTQPLEDWPGMVGAMGFALPMAAREDERRFLVGVALQGRDIVASNGGAAAIARDELTAGGNDLIIPLRVVPTVRQLPTVSAYARSESALALLFEKGRMLVQLVDSRFPDMRRFVPEKHADEVATVERDALARACAAMHKTREAQFLRFTRARGVLKLEDETPTARGCVEIEVAYDGRESSVGINPQYLAAAIDSLDGPHIVLSSKDDLSPILFTGGKASRSIVIMPARI